MAALMYRNARKLQWTTGLNLLATMKALLVMSDTTAHLDLSAEFLTGANGFGVLDEMTGAGYTRQTLASQVVDLDAGLDKARFKCGAINFGATITNGPRQVKGIILCMDGGSDAARVPVFFIDSVDSGPVFPYSPAGGQILVSWTNSIVARC